MKQKSNTGQYIAISVSVVVLVAVPVFLFSILTGGNKGDSQNNNQDKDVKETPFNPNLEENDTLTKVKKLEDHSVPKPNNLKKDDLFVPEGPKIEDLEE